MDPNRVTNLGGGGVVGVFPGVRFSLKKPGSIIVRSQERDSLQAVVRVDAVRCFCASRAVTLGREGEKTATLLGKKKSGWAYDSFLKRSKRSCSVSSWALL